MSAQPEAPSYEKMLAALDRLEEEIGEPENFAAFWKNHGLDEDAVFRVCRGVGSRRVGSRASAYAAGIALGLVLAETKA